MKKLKASDAKLIKEIKALRARESRVAKECLDMETRIKDRLKNGEYVGAGLHVILAQESRQIPDTVKIKKLPNWKRLMKVSKFRTLRIEPRGGK
jgi:hypothetical protein